MIFITHHCFLPRILCRFLFCLKAILSGSAFNISQGLFMAFVVSGKVQFYADIIGVLSDFVWFSWFSNCVLSLMIAFEICCCTCFLLYPLSISLSVSILDFPLSKYFRLFYKRVNRSVCENGMLRLRLSGSSDFRWK